MNIDICTLERNQPDVHVVYTYVYILYIMSMNEALVKQRHTFDNVTKFRANLSQLTRARLIRNYRIVLFNTTFTYVKQFITILRQSKVTWLNKGLIIAHIMIPIRSRISTKITHSVPLYEVNPMIFRTVFSDNHNNNNTPTTDQQRARVFCCCG